MMFALIQVMFKPPSLPTRLGLKYLVTVVLKLGFKLAFGITNTGHK